MPMLAETFIKSSKVSRIVISASIVAIVGILTYNWAVSPQASYIQAAQKYEMLSKDVDKKVKVIGNAIRVKKINLEKLQAGLDSINLSFFTTEQASDFFAQL
jgi:hypothetical protein